MLSPAGWQINIKFVQLAQTRALYVHYVQVPFDDTLSWEGKQKSYPSQKMNKTVEHEGWKSEHLWTVVVSSTKEKLQDNKLYNLLERPKTIQEDLLGICRRLVYVV